MSNVVVTNVPAVAISAAPTPHPGVKYAKTYKGLGVRNDQLIALQFVISLTVGFYNYHILQYNDL